MEDGRGLNDQTYQRAWVKGGTENRHARGSGQFGLVLGIEPSGDARMRVDVMILAALRRVVLVTLRMGGQQMKVVVLRVMLVIHMLMTGAVRM
jgi:hypothetical protein